jgi:hypothetical protein
MRLDTTRDSAFHILPELLRRCRFGVLIPAAHYFLAVSFTFLPLVVVGWFGPLSMTAPSGTLRMPFFYDAPTLCMYLVSLPCLLILTVTDNDLLNSALIRVQAEGILTISETNAAVLAKRWCRYFRVTNITAQALGLTAGIVVVYFTFVQAVSQTMGSWPAPDRQWMPNGYILLYCNFLFTVVTTVYVCRVFVVGFLLRDVVAHAELHILPLHPDKAGGLRPIGRLGLRNQYAITLLGLNIGLGVFVSVVFLKDNVLVGNIAVATIAYLVVGPLVFIWPLLPFRDGMMKNKAQLMSGVALRMRVQLDDLRARFQSDAITADDEQLIDRLGKIGAVIDELPVWPFDALTLRKFLAAYVIPTALGGLGAGLKILLHHYNIISD